MKAIPEILHEHPFFAGLDHDTIALLASCAHLVHAHPGHVLCREGERADTFYVVRSGRVAIQVHRPNGGPVVVDTAEAGDVVGWSWLLDPPRWHLDAIVAVESSVIGFDAACLRHRCDVDPILGRALLTRTSQVLVHRLMATRARLLDLYAAVS